MNVFIVKAAFYAGGPHEFYDIKAFLDEAKAEKLRDELQKITDSVMRHRADPTLEQYQAALKGVREVWPSCMTLDELDDIFVDTLDVEE